MIIYQIYPRSLYDTNEDGIGDLPGVVEKLPYIADLGADAVWICPFYTSPMRDFGYDISDFRGVDPIFGTLDDFDRVVETAHRLNLKVLIDQVWGHCSDEHPWFRESRSSRTNPRADWFTWADPREDGFYPNNWLSVFGGPAWTWNAARGQYYLHRFLHMQPSLNLWNDEVVDALIEESLFWADKGVDGFRIDAMPHFLYDRELRSNPPKDKRPVDIETDITAAVNPAKLQNPIYTECLPEVLPLIDRFRQAFRASGHDVFLLGEITRGGAAYAASCSMGNDRLHTAYGGELIKNELNTANIRKIMTNVQNVFDDPNKMTWSLGNHDLPRLWSRMQDTKKNPVDAWHMIVAWYFCQQGHLCWYQGDELGLEEADIPFDMIQDPYGKSFWPEFKGRDGCRTPMPWTAHKVHAGFSRGTRTWLPILPVHGAKSVEQQLEDQGSILNFVKEWMHRRVRLPALARGDFSFVKEADNDCIAFIREEGGQKLLCLFNFSEDRAVTHSTEVRSVLTMRLSHLEGNLVTLQPNGYLIAYIS